MDQELRGDLRAMVRGAYDVQKLRIQSGNRLVGNFKRRLGQGPGEKEEVGLSSEEIKILKELRRDYTRITDGIVNFPTAKAFEKLKDKGIISNYTEFCLTAEYTDLENVEVNHFNRLKWILPKFPIYTAFLELTPGVGPAMAGVIIGELDPEKAPRISSFWRYAGLDVAEDNKGRSRKKEHLIEIEYKDKEGNIQTKKSITYNPFLKAKLMGVLASSFLRAGKMNTYEQHYRNYKLRLENHATYKDVSAGHRHRMSQRYAIKRFLADLWLTWRPLEGLPITDEYNVAKLGYTHSEKAA